MKRILLASISFLLSAYSYSQGYIPFPSANASWTDEHYICDFVGGNGNLELTNTRYWYDTDTLIQGAVYHILNNNAEWYFQDCNQTSIYGYTYFPPKVVGYIRQDTFLKQIYYLHPDSNTEALLYDFNLAVGDTFLPSGFINPPYGVGLIKVGYIDTFYSDKPYARYHFEVFDSTANEWYFVNSWIEGIGSTAGLFYPVFYGVMGAGVRTLICFENSGTGVYPFFSNQTCAEITSLNEPTQLTKALKISPNPATTYTTITIDESLLNSTATLTDITGRRLMAVQLTTNQQSLNTSNLSNGVYFITLITNEGKSATKKLVVSR